MAGENTIKINGHEYQILSVSTEKGVILLSSRPLAEVDICETSEGLRVDVKIPKGELGKLFIIQNIGENKG